MEPLNPLKGPSITLPLSPELKGIDIDFKSYYFHYTKDYVEFLSIKNNIPLEEATKLFGKGWNVFGERGFGSGKFRDFTTFFSDAFAFKHGNSKDEIYNTYRFHALIDFFRILSYHIMDTERDISLYTEMVNYLASRYNNTKEIVIVDYGCGLAHITVTLCKLLKKVNIKSYFNKTIFWVFRNPLAATTQ